MNKDQLNIAITSMLAAAQRECDQSVGNDVGTVWTAHMTAAKVLMALAQVLMDVRDMEQHAHDKAKV